MKKIVKVNAIKDTMKERADDFCQHVLSRYSNVTCFVSKVAGSWVITGLVEHRTYCIPFWVGVPYREVNDFNTIHLQLSVKRGTVYSLTNIDAGIRWFVGEFRKQLVGSVREVPANEYSAGSGLRIIRRLRFTDNPQGSSLREWARNDG